MKKVTIALLVLLAALVIAFPSVRDELHWRWVSYKDQAKDYAGYLESWPDGRGSGMAKELYDERSWADTRAANTVQSFEMYVQKHPEGKYTSQARESLEYLLWQAAQGANTVTAYQRYIDAYPSGRFVTEAKSKKKALLGDNTPYLTVQKQGSRQAYETFLAQFPGHKREAHARAALKDMEGRDIVELLAEKKVEVKTRGAGIEMVSLEVRRLVNHEVTVRIPVGTFFVSRNPSAQNMVTTQEQATVLRDNSWVSVGVSAACANRPRDIPGSGDSFSIQRSPQQKELEKLMPVLRKAGVTFAVQQAAVWIVTDNANYGDLGILISGFGGFGPRVIREAEAAQAMKIVDDAGTRLWPFRNRPFADHARAGRRRPEIR